MRKFFIILLLMFAMATSTFAAKIPDDVKNFVKKEFPKWDMRFDGLVTLSDGTLYLPLLPSLIKNPEKIQVKTTYPQKASLTSKPNIIILNNDYVFLKVIADANNGKTVARMDAPPLEVKTGLLPQDMLVPRGLIIPDNIKGIIGGLSIPTSKDSGLKVVSQVNLPLVKASVKTQTNDAVSSISQLTNKTLYVATCYSKDIQVIEGSNPSPSYALSQKSIPIDMKAVNNDKLLLITTYFNNNLNIISLADEAVIKQIDLKTQPSEIIIDKKNQKAYVASPTSSSIFLIDLPTMLLKQKIRVNGMCEKLTISDDGTKIFYVDKFTNNIWVVELNNAYLLKNIGQFPNISKIAFADNKIYLSSRTKNRVAVIDYASLALIKEFEVGETPVDMYSYKGNLYILSARKNLLQVLNLKTDEISAKINLTTGGFPSKIYPLIGTNLALITDAKAGKYSVLNLDKKQIVKVCNMNIPVSAIAVVNKVKKINK